jgi:hypothetical protein
MANLTTSTRLTLLLEKMCHSASEQNKLDTNHTLILVFQSSMWDLKHIKMSKRLKRGDAREDGKVFWGYAKRYKNGEYWVSPEQLEEKRNISTKAYYCWRKKNKKCASEIRKRYRNKKRATDSVYLLKDRVRNLTTQAFRINGYSKKSRTHELLGCSWEFLKNYIEQRFKDGMTWGNRSKWHIDHIIPLSSANSEKELYKLFHYTNLQPLWAIENLQKKNKINKQLTFA